MSVPSLSERLDIPLESQRNGIPVVLNLSNLSGHMSGTKLVHKLLPTYWLAALQDVAISTAIPDLTDLAQGA